MSRDNDTKEIISMFSYARPMGSMTEDDFVARFLTPLGFRRDAHRNLWLQIATPDHKVPRILFSSHVDTVDRKEGIKTLSLGADGMLTLSKKDVSRGFTCLGADDTAGIWLMVQLARAKVPGLYVIHHGEESGCLGSSALARKSPEFLEGIEIALAFDRAGYTDVITHQMGLRTASQGFAWSLARQLDGRFEPSDAGVYTDTNEYADIVPECTNLAVGYFRQHSRDEKQDVPFLIRLRDSLLKLDWAALNVERDPHAWDGDDWGGGGRSWRRDDFWRADDEDYPRQRKGTRFGDLVAQYPDIAAAVLEAYGVRAEDFAEEIERETGEIVRRGVA